MKESYTSEQAEYLTPVCLVFRTSLQTKLELKIVAEVFAPMEKILKWSVDLDDWEKVMRVECVNLSVEKIIQILFDHGIYAREMLT